ncbi:hypothetical protein AAJ76_1350006334 [Vairimorpha ceranae]|uniref:Uncharacterized protein n=1 Tax=Vairimorpha ceranae TaxID=40302 RepID=A0A0F9W8I5_9MICR|nr:hypothetical protein AAJ76_1350006334 [Vairimorpha ceranae]KKO74026.1 hypothetical protein AAJ76_1350006334 [Vairimorpha ceranae]
MRYTLFFSMCMLCFGLVCIIQKYKMSSLSIITFCNSSLFYVLNS